MSGLYIPYLIAVAIGRQPNASRVSALGHNPNVGTATVPQDVWEFGGTFPWQTSAQTLQVSSSAAGDAAAGAGARTVLVSGLDGSYNPISETVTLNGTTPVSTVKQYLRVNVFTTTSSGSNHSNIGDLTLSTVAGGIVQSIARAGFGFGRSCIYSVPTGFTLFITSIYFSATASGSPSNVTAVCGIFIQTANGNQRVTTDFAISSSIPYRHDAYLGIVINSQSDFAVRCSSVGVNGTIVTAAMEGVLINNTI